MDGVTELSFLTFFAGSRRNLLEMILGCANKYTYEVASGDMYLTFAIIPEYGDFNPYRPRWKFLHQELMEWQASPTMAITGRTNISSKLG